MKTVASPFSFKPTDTNIFLWFYSKRKEYHQYIQVPIWVEIPNLNLVDAGKNPQISTPLYFLIGGHPGFLYNEIIIVSPFNHKISTSHLDRHPQGYPATPQPGLSASASFTLSKSVVFWIANLFMFLTKATMSNFPSPLISTNSVLIARMNR